MAPAEDARLARDVDRLTELLRDPEDQPDTADALVREHLEAARFYLLGSMPQEYELSIKMVEQLLPEVVNQSLRRGIQKFLDHREFRTAP